MGKNRPGVISCRALGFAVVAAILILLVIVMSPLFRPHGGGARKANCASNLKQLALAFLAYTADYNGVLPSSAACAGSAREFRTRLGRIPPPKVGTYKARTLMELLCPYQRNRDIALCPADDILDIGILWTKRSRKARPNDPSSYVMKKAVDDAWLDPEIKARRETDYLFAGDQIILYERKQFHWGGRDIAPDLGPGYVRLNTAYMDGHVRTAHIPDADMIKYHEPDYYNWNYEKNTPADKPEINPRVFCDNLR